MKLKSVILTLTLGILLAYNFIAVSEPSEDSKKQGKFVAISSGGEVALSTDGIEWTKSKKLPDEVSLNGICYGNGKFVAVGNCQEKFSEDGELIGSKNIAECSENGIDWTAATMPDDTDWAGVCYGNDKFVAVSCKSDKAAYSTDGINWETASLPFKPNESEWMECSGVCYGNGKFVAIITPNLNTYKNKDDFKKILYSTDGINWKVAKLPVEALWSSICYGNDKFVISASGPNIAAYSTDGIKWKITKFPVEALWSKVCYGDGKFVVSALGLDIAAYSTDGIIWTETKIPISARSITYGNGKFVAVAYERNSSKAAYSANGIDWTETKMPSETSWTNFCYGGD
jgi:hypothetical protein